MDVTSSLTLESPENSSLLSVNLSFFIVFSPDESLNCSLSSFLSSDLLIVPIRYPPVILSGTRFCLTEL